MNELDKIQQEFIRFRAILADELMKLAENVVSDNFHPESYVINSLDILVDAMRFLISSLRDYYDTATNRV